MRAVLGRLILIFLSLAVGLLLAEGVFTLLLEHPRAAAGLPGGVLSHLRGYYLHHDRLMVQAMPECSRYDEGLFYTLKPGECRFSNREFDTALRVNSAGLRDTEDALQAPEVIVLGDSFTMGWGVAQEEAFPQRLAALSGKRVLNAGVPSYGTVREARLLDRLDTSRLRFLVVQYDDNDSEENRLFEERGNELLVHHEHSYQQDLMRSSRRHGWYPGKVTYWIVRSVVAPERIVTPPVLSEPHQARIFLNALAHATSRDLSRVQVVVVDLNADRLITGDFTTTLQKAAVSEKWPPFLRGLQIADMRGQLEADDYFVLDDHLRPSGHAKVAARLLEKLREAGL